MTSRRDPGPRRRLAAAPAALTATLVVLVLTGCSPANGVSQNASDAAAAAQGSALALRQCAESLLIPGVCDTVLSDAMTELQDQDEALTGTGAVGGARPLRDQTLRSVRAAEDDVLAAQSALAAKAPASSLRAIAGRLAARAAELRRLEDRLEALS